MKKKLLGRLDGILVFQCEQDLNSNTHSSRIITCPNCLEHESTSVLNLSSKLMPTSASLFVIIERVSIGRSATNPNQVPIIMGLLPISFDWEGPQHFKHQFFDLTPILDKSIVWSYWSTAQPIGAIIDCLVRESSNWAYENQVRYRITQIGLVSGIYCTNCDSLTIIDPVLYGYHVKQSPIMKAGKDLSAVVQGDKLYIFNKAPISTTIPVRDLENPTGYDNQKLFYCEPNCACMEIDGIRIKEDTGDKKVFGVLDQFDGDSSKGMTNVTTMFSQLVELGNLGTLMHIYKLNCVVPIGNSDHMMKSSELLDLIRLLGVSLTEEDYGIGVIRR